MTDPMSETLPKAIVSALCRYRDALNDDDSCVASAARLALEAALLSSLREARDGGIEEAARTAELEPEPTGPIPKDLAAHGAEEVARAGVRATRKAIAARIRALCSTIAPACLPDRIQSTAVEDV